jgi:biotin carboxyl carrier protein
MFQPESRPESADADVRFQKYGQRGQDAMHALSIPERWIVAPTVGVFRSTFDHDRVDGRTVEIGQTVGVIDGWGTSTAVCSPFRGVLAGMLACDGERLRQGEPVAWLRVTRPET